MQVKINKQQELVLKSALEDYIKNLTGAGVKYNSAVEILNQINSSGFVEAKSRIPKVLLKKTIYVYLRRRWMEYCLG